LKEGGQIFGSNIVKTMDLSEWDQAIEEAEEYGGKGKVILRCNP